MEKKVLLFSGGFDSKLQEWLLKPDILLYVDMKTSYSKKELEELSRLPDYYKDRLIIKECPLGEYERENKYLPYRNLILGTLAMEYGQHVYFGFNRNDDAPDKDKVFLDKVNSLFRHLNKNCIGDMNWESKNFSFSSPFRKYSKTQMVKLCLKAGMPVDWILNTRSCYDENSDKGCGVCPVCVNKAIALLNNSLSIEGIFDTPIAKSLLEEKYNFAINSDDYSQDYIREIKNALTCLR